MQELRVAREGSRGVKDGSDIASVIDRITKLIARAAHEGTPEEEARSSAFIACRLIQKHGLAVGRLVRLTGPAQAQTTRPSSPPPPQPQATRPPPQPTRPPPQPSQPPQPTRPPPQPPQPRRPAPTPPPPAPPPVILKHRAPHGFVELASKFGGRCSACGEYYSATDRVAWVRKQGATHWGCRSYWSELCHPSETEASA